MSRTRSTALSAVLVAAGIGLVPTPAGAAEIPPGCAQTGVNQIGCTFTADGTFTVPADVTTVHIEAVGAAGGDAPVSPLDGSQARGGLGAKVWADVPVTPGTVLEVVMNAGGGAPNGGGASRVQTTDGAIVTPILIAGGGGGASTSFFGTNNAPGGLAGSSASGDRGGQGGTETAGGAGGTPECVFGSCSAAGSPGQFLLGGNGGGGSANGGGGGGGLYGGGGGAAAFSTAGGGGGGSSLAPFLGATFSFASRGTPPRVTISFAAEPLPTISFTNGAPPAGTVGVAYAFQYAATGDSNIGFSGSGLPPGLVLLPSGALSGTPSSAGTFAVTVTATGASGATASRTDAITISATPQAAGTLSPEEWDFGEQAIGTTSAPRRFTVTSIGTGPLHVGTIGTGSAEFSVSGDGCSGATVASGSSCTFDVSFTPSAAGGRSATVTVPTDAGNLQASVTGTGTTRPGATVTPTSLDFGGQPVGTTSASRPVTVTSTGTEPLTISAITTDSAEFAQTNNCPASLAPGASCQVAVTFTPSASGSRTGTLTISDNAGNQTVALSGTGVAQADLRISASATPNPVRSGALLSYTVRVVNDGPQAASAVRIVDTLPTASQFQSLAAPAGWTCTAPPVGQTGTVTCRADSMATGATATLTITVKVVAKARATVTNTANVTAATSDPDPADNSVTVATSVHGGNP